MKLSVVSACEAVTRWSLTAALFLTPLFFLPFTLYPVDLSKQFVFISLTLIAAIAWLVKAVYAGKGEYVKSPATIPLVSLVAFVVVSAFFSSARHISFVGRSGGETDTAIAVIAFALFCFCIAATFKATEDLKHAYGAFMAGAFFTMLAALPAVIQSLAQFAGYPFTLPNFADIGAFNTVGTANAFGLYAGLMAVFAFTGSRHLEQGRLRTGGYALSALCLIVAFLVGYWATFVALASAFVVCAAVSVRAEAAHAPRGNFIPLAVIVLSVCMLVLASGLVSVPVPRIATPPEVAPSVGASLHIAQATAREGVRSFLFGSGPSTYSYQYGKYHDADLNRTVFWSVQFTQGFNAILTHLVSWGILGTIIFLLFVGAIGRMLVRLGAHRHSNGFSAGFAASFVYIVVALILYPQNFTLYFFLFALAGMVAALYAAHTDGLRTLPFTSSPYGAFALPLGMMLLVAAFVALLYVNGRRYSAGVQFARGVTIANATKDIEKALPFLIAGIALDAENDAYLTALASAYITQANALIAAAGTAPTADARKKVEDMVASAVAAALRATQVNPKNAQNWIVLGQVYEAVAPFNANAVSLAFGAYDTAASLEPMNPAIPTYLGSAHSVVADRIKGGSAAEDAIVMGSFEKALVLKADYAPAHFAIIRMFDRAGKTEDAVARAERLRALAPDDAGVLLDLGILHYNAGRRALAQDVLEQAVRVAPDYANALYFLGLAYERAGDRVRTLAAFEHVLKLNPQNGEIKAMVDNVRVGKPALNAGVEPTPLKEKK